MPAIPSISGKIKLIIKAMPATATEIPDLQSQGVYNFLFLDLFLFRANANQTSNQFLRVDFRLSNGLPIGDFAPAPAVSIPSWIYREYGPAGFTAFGKYLMPANFCWYNGVGDPSIAYDVAAIEGAFDTLYCLIGIDSSFSYTQIPVA